MNQGPDRIDYRETSDITEVHAAVQREKPEPSAEVTPMPLWLTGLCAGAMVWAGTYFGIFHGGLNANVFNEYESSPAVLFPLPPKPAGAGAGAEVEQSLAQIGKGVYSNCASCHGPAGAGTAGQYPPLAGSEWVVGSEKRLVGIILKGLKGPLTIQGAQHNYTGNMVAWESTLSDKKIAAVASYIRSSWGNNAPEISEAKVKAARAEFVGQKEQWTEELLHQIPADATLPDAAGKAAPAAGAPAAGGAVDMMAEGKKNYSTICMACHQGTGLGLPPAFPPLAKSEYVNGDPKRFAAIVLKGVMGPITVDGKQFNGVMPGQEQALSDAKIASILTYVRGSFGNTGSPVTAEIVAEARKEHAARTTSWTEEELKALGGAK
jgi:mono/diheme cytochrome c family protein